MEDLWSFRLHPTCVHFEHLSQSRIIQTPNFRALFVLFSAKYRGLNTDLSKVDDFRIHETDVGSSQVQVARFTARVTQLTEHLKVERRLNDYSTLFRETNMITPQRVDCS